MKKFLAIWTTAVVLVVTGVACGKDKPLAPSTTTTTTSAVALGAPVVVSPAVNAAVAGAPQLTVADVIRSGSTGPLSYKFEVADSAAFTHIVFTATVAEQANQTTASVTTTLADGVYYWRVQVIDTLNAVTTPVSDAQPFQYSSFNMAQATIWDSPSDLGRWPETSTITSVDINGGGILVDFDRREGPGRWPDEPFGDGDIEYTLGMCMNIDGHWNCSAVVQFWNGRELEASGRPSDVYFEWFYDAGRWGPMTYRQPSYGELVGVFAGSGNLRGRKDPSTVSCPRVCERTNVAFVTWPF